MKRQRIEELVYIRAICAFGIFLIHLSGAFAVSSVYQSRTMYLGVFFNQFFRFGSPIFMMISGFVLFYNYRNFDEFAYKEFYYKKFKYILIPYLFWSIFYYVINHYGNIIGGTDLLVFTKTIILGSAFPHLYFIFLIFQFYLLYPLFIKFFIKTMKERPIFFYLTCLLLQSAILIYQYSFKVQSDNAFITFFNKYYWKSVFAWFYYFLTGGILALHYKKLTAFIDKNILKLIPVYIISLILYLGEVYLNIWQKGGRDYYDKFGSIRPMTIIYATFTMIVLIKIAKRINNIKGGLKNIIKDIGTYSLGIYFLHPFVLEFIKTKIINNYPSIFGYSRISTLFFLIISAWTCTMAIVLLLSGLRFNGFIIGRVPVYKYRPLKFFVREKESRERKI